MHKLTVIFAIFLLVAGLGVGIVLMGKPQFLQPQASSCSYKCCKDYSCSTCWCDNVAPADECSIDDDCAPCACDGQWKNNECGGWECPDSKRHQSRVCSPSGCDIENRCVRHTNI